MTNPQPWPWPETMDAVLAAPASHRILLDNDRVRVLEVVIEVTFDRWTSAGRMRAPVYQGLRDDKDAADVVRET